MVFIAGRGPAPKPKAQRARRNKDTIPTKTFEVERSGLPDLPEDVGVDWHPQTRRWWKTWQESPMVADFTSVDVDYLIDTAFLHHLSWSKGQWTLFAEVRQRVAAFGATPADRARLRIEFVDAEQAESNRRRERSVEEAGGSPGQSVRDRFEGLKLVEGE